VASVLSSWTRTVVDALSAQGIDPQPVLEAAGLSAESFRNPNARHPVAAARRLWKNAAVAAGDPAFGLVVPRYAKQTTFYALGYAVLASATLHDALDRLVRFCQVVIDAGLLELDVRDERAALRITSHPGYEVGGHELRDSALSIIVRMGRRLTNGAFELDLVELRRSSETDLTPYRNFFGCDVRLGPNDCLWFASSLLSLPLPTANAELASFNEAVVDDYLKKMATGTIVDRVRWAISEQMSQQLAPEMVARRIGMSLRSMQRALQEHETSYEQVLRDLRSDLARAYLREGRYSLTEVAFLLGYESLSAFARAFRRWTGMTPTDFVARSR